VVSQEPLQQSVSSAHTAPEAPQLEPEPQVPELQVPLQQSVS
jgi:hypothetical protein